MNYYDELGLSTAATAEEIREAYRRVAKLLHPDQQQSEEVRKLADLQMKRINTIADVLTDPEQRRRYDQAIGLEPALPAPPLPPPGRGVPPHGHRERTLGYTPPPRPPRSNISLSRLFGHSIWVVTGLIGAGSIIWYFAAGNTSKEPEPGSRTGVILTQDKENPEPQGSRGKSPRRNAAPKPGAPQRSTVSEHRVPVRQAGADARTEDARHLPPHAALQPNSGTHPVIRPEPSPEDLPAQGQQTSVLRQAESPLAPAASSEGRSPEVPQPPQATITAKIQPGATRGSPDGMERAPAQNPYAGSWFYPRPKSTPGMNDLYPPEFIELAVSEDAGRIRGSYRARYRVPDRPIRPDVAFRFEGPNSSLSPARFRWMGSGGSKGEVQLTRLSENSIEVNWIVDEVGRDPGLGSGTAILIRRME